MAVAYDRMSSRHAAAGLLLGAAFVYIEVLLAWTDVSASGATILDLELTWDTTTARDTMGALGRDGVREYMRIEGSLDLVFPVVYAALLMVLIDATTPWRGAPAGAGPLLRAAIVLPAVAAAADFVENTAIIALCREHLGVDTSVSAAHVFVGGRIATPLKWVAVAASCVVVAAGAVRCARHRCTGVSGNAATRRRAE